ncbi:hypothetical protein JNUCC64_03605 [Streptomyces sp. JNUCC 64]
MRSRTLLPALALGGVCALGATLLLTAADGDASPGRAGPVAPVTGPPGGAPEEPRRESPKEPQEDDVTPVPQDSGSPARGGDEERSAVHRSGKALADAGLPAVPDGWRAVRVRREAHEDRPVTVVRYERGTRRVLGGEHVTTVVDREGTLLGYTRMTPDPESPSVPSDEAAEGTAFAWLERFAPDHAEGLSTQWVDRHDEEVRDRAGTVRAVSGAKVKTRHESGLYTWVIVGGDGEVVTYERDVRWDSSRGRRATAMWLHDKWIAAREGTGPRPGAPYAPVEDTS